MGVIKHDDEHCILRIIVVIIDTIVIIIIIVILVITFLLSILQNTLNGLWIELILNTITISVKQSREQNEQRIRDCE